MGKLSGSESGAELEQGRLHEFLTRGLELLGQHDYYLENHPENLPQAHGRIKFPIIHNYGPKEVRDNLRDLQAHQQRSLDVDTNPNERKKVFELMEEIEEILSLLPDKYN